MENKNQPAYPQPFQTEVEMPVSGLTKREVFAMAAMQGILANPNWKFSEGWAATEAIGNADALLKQLE